MVKQINQIGNPILNKKCVNVDPIQNKSLTEVFNNEQSKWSAEVVQLIEDLKDTATAHLPNCIGLSSNQIWDKETPCPSICVIRGLDNNGQVVFLEFINPTIKTSGHTIKIEEQCMSVPDYVKMSKREENVTITYQTLQSIEKKTDKFYGKFSDIPFVFQHELDHLNGKLIKYRP